MVLSPPGLRGAWGTLTRASELKRAGGERSGKGKKKRADAKDRGTGEH